MDQVFIKYTNTFHCKTLQHLPKVGFLVRKQTIWQPWTQGHFGMLHYQLENGALRSNVDIQITDLQNIDKQTEKVEAIWSLMTAPVGIRYPHRAGVRCPRRGLVIASIN
jgi:hypothetical protein